MPSDAQNAANLANAQHSTGPRTEEGKAVSSLNALKHGLTAKTVLLPGEDPAEYQAMVAGFRKDLEPLNTIESALTQQLVDLQWRLQRVSCIEARILSADSLDTKALNAMSLHAARLKRQYSATLKELRQMQKERHAEREKELEQATSIYRADQLLGRGNTVDSHGFDFTAEHIGRMLHTQQAVYEARDVVSNHESEELEFDDAA
jgi:hypothetical protein